MYYVYLLKCADKSLYAGITVDLENRLKKHKEGTASRYTRAKGAMKIVYSETHPSRSAASKREAEIKKWPRRKKLLLIKSQVK